MRTASADGCLRMFFCGVPGGGGWSLKTRRPLPSIHWYWAWAVKLAVAARAAKEMAASARAVGFMGCKAPGE